MGPPSGSCTPDSRTPKTVCSDTDTKPAQDTGRDQHGNSSHSGSKRSAQHADYHKAETKRRKEGAERAAQVQKRATQLVQQLAAPDGQSVPQETSGTLAKAVDRQNTYNISIDSKPWASGKDRVSHAIDPTAGLPMQTGHYSDTETSGGQPSGDAPQDAAADGSTVEQPNSEPSSDHGNGDTKEGEDISEDISEADAPVEQTNSEPSSDHGDSETKEDEQHSKDGSPVDQTNSEPSSDHGEGDKGGDKHNKAGSQSPASSGGASFICTQDRSAGQSSPDKAAIKDRQMDEQTHQNHPQNRSESGGTESGKSLPPVIQKLHRAQQRAHDELEAAEKESSDYRFPAEAGQRFVTNASKNKAKLDVAVYEHGRNSPSCYSSKQ